MKRKTWAAWLAFLGGPVGLHRFYLHGPRDPWGWALFVPTLLGIYGIERVQAFGQDDVASWLLVPLLGFTIAGCCLTAIVYGLMTREAWNARFNPGLPQDAAPGGTSWLTIFAVAIALMVGAAVLMASIAFSFQRYFEYQVEEGRRISQ
jgi:hypothetical protein